MFTVGLEINFPDRGPGKVGEDKKWDTRGRCDGVNLGYKEHGTWIWNLYERPERNAEEPPP